MFYTISLKAALNRGLDNTHVRKNLIPKSVNMNDRVSEWVEFNAPLDTI